MKRKRLNLLLLCITALLFVVILNDAGNEAQQQQAKILEQTNPDTIFRIHIERQNQPPITLIRKGQDWHMTEPLEGIADPARTDALLSLPAAHIHQQFDINDLDPLELKLQPPKATLTLDKQVFTFGDYNPLNDLRYVLFSNQVYLLTDRHYHHLVASAESWLRTSDNK